MNNNQTNTAPAKVEVAQFKGLEANREKVAEVVKGPDNKDKKNKVISIVVLILIVATIFFFGGKKTKNSVSTVEGCAKGDTFSATSGEPCFPDNIKPCVEGEEFNKETGEPCPTKSEDESALNSGISPNAVLSNYDNALIKYTNKSLLFDMNCVATPAVLEIPLGTTILIANNSTENTLDFKIADRAENLRSLHYMLSSTFNTIGEFAVSCNGKDSATVKVK